MELSFRRTPSGTDWREHMSPISGWHTHRVYCNSHLIASFPTERMRDAFLSERRQKYPRNDYTHD
jgi:hypothetical protein